MDLCWTCIGAPRAKTLAGRAPHRSCDRHTPSASPVLARTRSQQARAGAVKRPQPRAGAYRQRQFR
ncbi:MAG: hypothetical protein WCI61_02200 [Chloroflexota bacterium]